ncbi:MAG: DUF1513 domain-containing protein [Alphaproteobacteria bacterium]
MAIDRRELLLGLAACLVLPGMAGSATAAPGRIYLSARGDAGGGFRASAFDEGGRGLFDLPLPGRGHSLALRPGRAEAVFFARRPDRFACAIDLAAGVVTASFETPESRHFYGHGLFDPAGRLLYATENDFAAGRGVIGLYDAEDGYRRVGELPSHGVGPHDLRLLSDGTTLVVANGGMETHPDMPRAALNVPEMTPSLAYIDRRDGRLLAEMRLAPSMHLLSIRHLAIGRSDRVAFAMQYQGPVGDAVPLIGVQMPDGTVRLFDEPTAELRRMRQYCGSVAFDAAGRTVAATSPRGNVAVFWDVESTDQPRAARVADVCGVSATARPGEFLLSSGQGGVFRADAGTGALEAMESPFLDKGLWDNHILTARI